jgi:hypothetical protein
MLVEALAELPEDRLDLVERVRLVAGCDGRVRREHGLVPNGVQCGFGRTSGDDECP